MNAVQTTNPEVASTIDVGGIARAHGFSILKFIKYIREELLIVLGTSSSETVLPHMMQKMQRLGASPSVVGLVIPTGYSFNLDGTNIYMTLAALFIAQATDTPLSYGEQGLLLLVAMLSSKGAAGVTGAGFITLAATLAVVDPRLVPGMAIVLGIDNIIFISILAGRLPEEQRDKARKLGIPVMRIGQGA